MHTLAKASKEAVTDPYLILITKKQGMLCADLCSVHKCWIKCLIGVVHSNKTYAGMSTVKHP